MDENKGRHTCRYRGDGDEGSTLGASFFAYENKRREHKDRIRNPSSLTYNSSLTLSGT
jgi:hypothetical protein